MKKPYKYVRARCGATQPVIPALRIGGGIQLLDIILRRKILINSFYTNIMTYQIDQSGKIESTSKLTVVAVANGVIRSIVIKGVEKRRLITAMKNLDYPKTNYVYKIFAALIFMIIQKWVKTKLYISTVNIPAMNQ